MLCAIISGIRLLRQRATVIGSGVPANCYQSPIFSGSYIGSPLSRIANRECFAITMRKPT
jgi:hypothetical protein